MPRGRVGPASALLAPPSLWLTVVVVAMVASWSDPGAAINTMTQQQQPSNVERIAPELADESVKKTEIFTNLMQLSEAVLAPVWSTGGFAYAMTNTPTAGSSGTWRRVCAHTRVLGGGVAAPYTFSMFDTQFSPLYLVSPSTVKSAGGAISLAAQVAGRLDLQQGCYTTVSSHASQDGCAGVLQSLPTQCALGELDGLHVNWTADSLAAAASATHKDEPQLLSAKGLSAAELLAVFLNDYLPQRAWLRTVVPRVVGAIAHAEQAARAYNDAPLLLSDAAEAADMQRAVAGQWEATYGSRTCLSFSVSGRFCTALPSRRCCLRRWRRRLAAARPSPSLVSQPLRQGHRAQSWTRGRSSVTR
ncbi:hypothetical protein LSCM1_03648 [Leishmania martiniquensis]|uniref:Uncharacterized protein n=1 Tax=Leishmania martiniquensis TaxID=1580590 RepID=A0A836KDF9_9TRYP|nr:hypothetical protein LSCM1_03648 [Leishmania martiniquensis]